MPYNELKTHVWKMYRAALELRSFAPPEIRTVIHRNFFIATVFVFVLAVIAYAAHQPNVLLLNNLDFIVAVGDRLYGLFLILFSITFILSSFEALHRSYYFHGLEQIIDEGDSQKDIPVSWEVATIIHGTSDTDITEGFIHSDFGEEILYRLGVHENEFLDYEEKRTPTLTAESFFVEREKGVVLASYARSIYKHDESFRHFLSKSNINEEQLVKTAQWVTRIERRERLTNRWWSRDSLGRIPGLGKTWSYGETWLLERYGHDLTEDPVWPSAQMTRRSEDDEVEEVEEILSKSRQSNALLLTDDVMSARRRTAQLYHKIREGHALPTIEDKKIYLLDIESILVSSGEKSAFENELIKTINQAIASGNVILYIEHITTAIKSAESYSVDLLEVLSEFFESSGIQIIIGELAENFDKKLSKDTRLTKTFDVVQMKEVKSEGVLELLEQRAVMFEKKSDIVFTLPALEQISLLADRYFPTGVMPDKAFDLLEELAPVALAEHVDQITAEDVQAMVSRKTNVPIGTPKEDERKKLLNLEDELHKRVISQDVAVSAVARALRRARAGVGSHEKPLGTFLFLGPTGVGKTETAKALAEILFEDENAMTRLDMSEFQSDTALDDLIGSAGSGKTGRLEALIRKRQYGVLLLDEFEKSDRTVHDLFLQILDEGSFTDAFGKSVNMRNLVIIATSNAGADLIWEWEKEGKDVVRQKQLLIDNIIKRNLFRPELINRFDDVVVFHTLKKDHVKDITKIHLEKFAERILKEKNIKLNIDDNLISFVASKGYSEQFGGRELERAIQDLVEQTLADEILAGHAKPGGEYTFEKFDTIAQKEKEI